MTTEPPYKDLDGTPTSLHSLCRKEPDWAAGRIKSLRETGERMVEERRKLWVDAFIRGAKWWEYEKTQCTMWQSDQAKAARAAWARVDCALEEEE